MKLCCIWLLITWQLWISMAQIKLKPPDMSENNIYRNLITTLKLCFSERLTTVIANQDLNEMFQENLWGTNPPPVILIDGSFDVKRSHHNCPNLPTFILTADSEDNLKETLQQLKKSAFFKIDVLLFVIGNSKQSCANASRILMTAWKMNFLWSFYFCSQSERDVSMYTFNPFTNRAPHPWQEVDNYDKPDDRWTLYARSMTQENRCENVNFDKRKFLDGYKVNGITSPAHGYKWESNVDYNVSNFLENGVYLTAVFVITRLFAMNITLVVHYDEPGYYRNGTAEGFLIRILNGTEDFALSVHEVDKLPSTYPVTQSNYHILTQHSQFLQANDQVLNYFDIQVVILTGVIVLVTFVIFIISSRGQLSRAGLNVLSLLLSYGIQQRLSGISMKIYILCIFWLIFVLNAQFQATFSASHTRLVHNNIDTMEELRNHDYHIYIFSDLKKKLPSGFSAGIPEENIHLTSDIDCSKYVVNDPKAACINALYLLIRPAKKYGLYVSKSPIEGHFWWSHWCRDGWQFVDKFNMISITLFDMGLFQGMATPFLSLLWTESDHVETTTYQTLELQDLTIAFSIYAIGLAISLICFIFELALPRRD